MGPECRKPSREAAVALRAVLDIVYFDMSFWHMSPGKGPAGAGIDGEA
jgi:hypothetical protein